MRSRASPNGTRSNGGAGRYGSQETRRPTARLSSFGESSVVMAISKTLRQILACPKCKSAVEVRESDREIHCRRCLLAFRIEEDVPIMMEDQARSTRD